MPSAKYIGYLSGVAVAAGVGAALAVSGQGTAYADTDTATSSSAKESKESSRPASSADDAKSATGNPEADDASRDIDAGPRRTAGFDPAETVRELKKTFRAAQPDRSEAAEEPDEADEADEAVETELEVPAASPEADLTDLAATSTTDLADETVEADIDSAAAADGPVPWSPNPFRPMPPEPAPNDMPGVLWGIEQAVLDVFEPVPFVAPFVREGYEAGFRVSQMIPWVNAVIPVVNIAGQVPNLLSGDPVVSRAASQNMINNLLVTIHPVSVLYYGYDEIADVINLEYESQQLKEAFYATTWNILDPLALLHNRGESGLPLSPSSPSQAPEEAAAVRLAAAVDVAATTDDPGSDPFRADDPDPIGMPQALIDTRNLIGLILPPAVKPVYREGFELVYRATQIVPFVNTALPAAEIVPALIQALGGDRSGAQLAINQLLLTTGPVSLVYYVYDQVADLLNVEDAAFAAKAQLYSDVWDAVDPAFLLHEEGESGLVRA